MSAESTPAAPATEPQARPHRVGSAYPHDEQIWNRIEKTVATHERALRDVLESFPLYARRVNLTRFLAHYELYKRIAPLAGSILECGVYRGSTLMTWAKLLEIFHPGDRSRKVIGFDNFAGFGQITEEDGLANTETARIPGGWSAGPYYEELREHMEVFQDDSFLPRDPRIELVVGDLVETAPAYVTANPGLRIALLHLDVDVYEPTLAALEAFYPQVVHGGIVVFDEYGLRQWPGESRAVDKYFGRNAPRIEKLPYCSTPGGFMHKGDV
jgi:hypothetical protein